MSMEAKYQVIALSSLDPSGTDRRDEPKLAYPDALKAAREFKREGKAFRVHVDGPRDEARMQSLVDLGAVI